MEIPEICPRRELDKYDHVAMNDWAPVKMANNVKERDKLAESNELTNKA